MILATIQRAALDTSITPGAVRLLILLSTIDDGIMPSIRAIVRTLGVGRNSVVGRSCHRTGRRYPGLIEQLTDGDYISLSDSSYRLLQVDPCGAQVDPCGAQVDPCGAQVDPCGAGTVRATHPQVSLPPSSMGPYRSLSIDPREREIRAEAIDQTSPPSSKEMAALKAVLDTIEKPPLGGVSPAIIGKIQARIREHGPELIEQIVSGRTLGSPLAYIDAAITSGVTLRSGRSVSTLSPENHGFEQPAAQWAHCPPVDPESMPPWEDPF